MAVTRARDHLVVALENAKSGVSREFAERVHAARDYARQVDAQLGHAAAHVERTPTTWSVDLAAARAQTAAVAAQVARPEATLAHRAVTSLTASLDVHVEEDPEDAVMPDPFPSTVITGEDDATSQQSSDVGLLVEDDIDSGDSGLALPRPARLRADLVGSLVHDVLERAPLADVASDGPADDWLEPALRVAAARLGCSEADIAEARIRLGVVRVSPLVRRVAELVHHKEVPLSYVDPTTGILVEGRIDLLVEEPDGSLHVIDYKTDSSNVSDEEFATEEYARQVRNYVTVVSRLTGLATAGSLLRIGREKASQVTVGPR